MFMSLMFFPLIRISPDEGSIMRLIIRMEVVFLLPLVPDEDNKFAIVERQIKGVHSDFPARKLFG